MLAGLVEKGIVQISQKLAVTSLSVSASTGVVGGGVILRPLTVSCCRLYSNYYRRRNNNRDYNGRKDALANIDRGSGGGDDGGGYVRKPRMAPNQNNREKGWRKRGANQISPIKMTSNYKKSANQRHRELMEMNMHQYRKEFRREVREYGDPIDEPDPEVFSKKYGDYVRETEEMKDRIKTRRLTKKHFRDVMPQELSLLTWAEKENIKYLMESDPEQWTPEAISEAYPISMEGAEKMMRSSMRLRTVKDVRNHDERVAYKIKLVQKGVIPMTEDMERRWEIRKKCGPVRVGHLGMNSDQFFHASVTLPKELGEFARIVAPPTPPPSLKEKEEVKYLKDGDFYDPSSTGADTEYKNEVPLKQQLSNKQLRRMLPVSKLMTFSEFEGRMKEKGAEKKAGDMKYMLEELGDPEDFEIPTATSPEKIDLPFGKGYNPQFPSNIEKYRKPEETGEIEIQVEGNQAYLYQPETGYQKPYAPSNSNNNSSTSTSSGSGNGTGDPICPEIIEIPEEMRSNKPGATYKVGSAYYDENGEFLYKVV